MLTVLEPLTLFCCTRSLKNWLLDKGCLNFENMNFCVIFIYKTLITDIEEEMQEVSGEPRDTVAVVMIPLKTCWMTMTSQFHPSLKNHHICLRNGMSD